MISTFICLLSTFFNIPSATRSLTITSQRNYRIVKNKGIHVRKSENFLTTVYSKRNEIDIDVLKDINIDDVLLEAEKALDVAQTSLGDDGGIDEQGGENRQDTIQANKLPSNTVQKTSIEAIEIISSTIGGIILGSLLGTVATFTVDFSPEASQYLIPNIAGATILGGTLGFAGSLQDNTGGVIVRNILGAPAKTFASAIVNNIKEAAREQVEKTTNGIKSIPSNVANSAKQTVAQKASEAKVLVIPMLKQMVLVSAILLVAVALWVQIINGQFVAEMPTQQY